MRITYVHIPIFGQIWAYGHMQKKIFGQMGYPRKEIPSIQKLEPNTNEIPCILHYKAKKNITISRQVSDLAQFPKCFKSYLEHEPKRLQSWGHIWGNLSLLATNISGVILIIIVGNCYWA